MYKEWSGLYVSKYVELPNFSYFYIACDSVVSLLVTASICRIVLVDHIVVCFLQLYLRLMLPSFIGSDYNFVLPGLISVPFWRRFPFFPAVRNTDCFRAHLRLAPLRSLQIDFQCFHFSSFLQPAFFTLEKLILSAFSPKINLFSDKRLCQFLNIVPFFDF